MNKKLNILGRKVSVLAVMMALLVIGTASAALIVNYATLSGTFEVTNPITVTGSDFEAGIGGGAGVFTITNTDETTVPVDVLVTLSLDATSTAIPYGPVTNDDGIVMTIIVDDGTVSAVTTTLVNINDCGEYDTVIVTVPAASDDDAPVSGSTTVTVTFATDDPAVEPGIYTINVAINPYTAPEQSGD